MADKGSITAIKAEIDEKIIPNNNAQLITGEKLNDTLQDTVDTLDAQYRTAIQQVADDLDTEREVREAEEDAIRGRIDEVDAAQASGVNSALQRIEAEKAAREGADESIRETLSDVQSDLSWTTSEVQRVGEALDDETAAREELAQEVDQQGTRLTAAEGVGTTNTANIAVLTGKAAVAADDIQQLKNRATNDEAELADHEQRITENAGAVSGLRDRATILEGKVGDLSTLHTTDKASLVRAINEVLGNPAIARYLFVSWSDKIRPHAANFVALMNNYDMIVVRSRGTVITTYHDTSAIMYEYSEGWRIGTLEGLTLDDDTSFRDMLEYLDEHSSFIASKADIAAVTGDLSDLTTEDKSSLVGAINEVKAGAGKTIPDFAHNLVPTGAPSEVEFSSRPTGQGVPGILGSEEVKVVKGKSLVWNQLWRKEWAPTTTQSGITLTNNGDGSYTANGTANGDIDFYAFIVPVIGGHKYLLKGCPQGGGANTYSLRLSGVGYDYGEGKIGTISQTYNTAYEFHFANGVTCSNLVFRPQMIDLTKMFGAGNEPATYEEFLSRKPIVEDEFAYNEGEIVNNSVKAIEVTGRNLWDEEWEVGGIGEGVPFDTTEQIRSKNFTPCSSRFSYYFKTPNVLFVFYYDKNKNYLGYLSLANAQVATFPADTAYFKITDRSRNTYNHDICINLSDPAFNGQYVPYVAPTTIDLSWVKGIKDGDGNVLFPDGLKGVGNVYDEAGQTRAVKRFGVKVFDGTEAWSHNWNGYQDFYPADSAINNSQIVCNRYTYNATRNNDLDLYCTKQSGRLFFKETGKTDGSLETWQQYLRDLYAQGNPLVVIYELAEPIEVTYPKQETLAAIEGGGIETAIADGNSAPFKGAILYGLDVYKTLVSLVQAQAATTAEE